MNINMNAFKQLSRSFPVGPFVIHQHNHNSGEYWATIGYRSSGPIGDVTHFSPCFEFKYLAIPVEEQKKRAEVITRLLNAFVHNNGVDVLYDLIASYSLLCRDTENINLSTIDKVEKAQQILSILNGTDIQHVKTKT